MKRIVPKEKNFTTLNTVTSPIKWLVVFLFAICFSFNASAQGCQPQMAFESFGNGIVFATGAPTYLNPLQITSLTQGGSWYGSGVTSGSTLGYNGSKCLIFNGNTATTDGSTYKYSNSFIITPLITSASNAQVTLSFVYRNTTTAASVIRVEFISASSYTPGSTLLGVATSNVVDYQNGNCGTCGLTSYASTGSYTFNPGTTGGYVKITRMFTTTSTSGVASTANSALASGGVPSIDDVSWYSATFSENSQFVMPRQPVVASGTCTTVALPASSSYNFYDNGGKTDNYGGGGQPYIGVGSSSWPAQNYSITYTPASGQIIQLTLNSLNVNSPSTGTLTITGVDNPFPSSPPTGYSYSGNVATMTATYTTTTPQFNSTNCDGTVTVNFTTSSTSAATSNPGFDITVKSLASTCVAPSSFAVTSASITQTSAPFTWSAACPAPGAGYDYYISTNASPTLPGTTTAVTNSSTSSLQVGTTTNTSTVTVTGLSSGTTYYAWIRSNCGSGNYSTWNATAVTFKTLCPALAVPPTYTLDYQSNPAVLQGCTTVFPTGAYNTANTGANNYIITNSSGSWYVTDPLTLTNGLSYTFSVDAASSSGTSTFLVNYYSTSGAITAAGLSGGTSVIGSTSTSSTTFATYSSTFSCTATGTYYIGIYLTSGNIRLDNIILKQVCGPKTWDGTAWTPTGAPTVNDNLIFNGNYTGTGNATLLGCACTVNSPAVVTFNSGDVLSLSDIVTVNTGGTLTFNDQSSLIQSTTNANSGNITYKRTTTPVRKYDYTYWSTPVSAPLLQTVSPNTGTNVFFLYNNATQAWNYVDPTVTAMTTGIGYIIRAPNSYNVSTGATYTAPFTGIPNNGTYSTTIYANNNLNLIGNPYPSAISASSLVTDPANSSILDGTLYFWTHNLNIASGQYNAGDYATWTSLGGAAATNSGVTTSPHSGKIGAGQSFFVKGIGTSNGTAYFKNSMRLSGTSDNSTFFRQSSSSQNHQAYDDQKSRVWIDIANTDGAFKEVLVGYVNGATSGRDRLFDGEMIDIGNPITLYTKINADKFTIQGVGLPFHDTDTFPLGYKSTIDGTFTISLNNFDGLFTNQNIYLEDTVLNTITDLKLGTYTFTTLAGTFEDRFVVRFNNNTALAVNHSTFDTNTIVVYKNQDGLHINSGVIDMDNVKIYDLSGRLISEKNAVQAVDTLFTNVPVSPQILLVQITSIDGVTVTKKIGY